MFSLSKHAIEQMEMREISSDMVFDVLESPDKIDFEDNGQLVYQKIIVFTENNEYLVRVFVNSEKESNLVKTAYRTSKFSKYL